MFSAKWSFRAALAGMALPLVLAPAARGLEFCWWHVKKHGGVLVDPVTFGHFGTRWRVWPVPRTPPAPEGSGAPFGPAPGAECPAAVLTGPAGVLGPTPSYSAGAPEAVSLPAPRPVGERGRPA